MPETRARFHEPRKKGGPAASRRASAIALGAAYQVVGATGRPPTARRAVGALRPRGELALLGGEVTFDVRGLFPLDRLGTTFPFEDIGAAVAVLCDGSAVEPVLTFVRPAPGRRVVD
ncbi:hypothetical protein QFZ75_001650 [Streptomyces sp. V3I8]|uniref:hypothetical protein n=1 Tax=Streptomyces sp. V3I8 TaxID=3042279 RepID=UPI002781987F|nr:hypothetical protein [Streptomyces sp. V3I8]MDQ1035234.1 hypothetical protein [Streptomyces sp. V3I8]